MSFAVPPVRDCDRTLGSYQRRPRLLFLCHTLPYPPDSGAPIRAFNLLRVLVRDFDVTALCFHRGAARPTVQHIRTGLDGLQRIGVTAEAFPVPQAFSRRRLFWDHIRSLVRRRPYTVFAYESMPFMDRLKQLIDSHEFDLVHVDSIDLAGCLELIGDVPVVINHHNVESLLLARRAQALPRGVRRAYVHYQSMLVENEEVRVCQAVALNTTVSELDRTALEQISPGASFEVVRNGVDTQFFQPALEHPENRVVFVGPHDWLPNRDAMTFFCEQILPLVRSAGIDAEIMWVGKASASVRRAFSQKYGVQMTGYVEDIRPFVQSALCYIAPVRIGSGTRMKILDGWAMGKAVVSTSIGCEGLLAHDGENILIRDTAEGFAQAVEKVLRDEGTRRKLERGARETAVQEYDWESIGSTMVKAYSSQIETATRTV